MDKITKWKKSTPSVYYQRTKDNILTIDKTDINFIKRDKILINKKSRICSHPSPKNVIHEMIIFHKKGAYVRPHKHIKRIESFHLIYGNIEIVLFNNIGKPIQTIKMGNYLSGKIFYYRMQKSFFHTLIIHKNSLFQEVTSGPFNIKDTIQANWAPLENETKKIAKFLKNLKEKIKYIS